MPDYTDPAKLRELADRPVALAARWGLVVAADEIERLQAFLQWVADTSREPSVVNEARRNGAKASSGE